MIKNWVFILFFTLLAISCNQKQNNVANENIPTFSTIDFDSIFTQQDKELEHKDSIKEYLSNYYHTTWESGNLWGGLLIAKGDEILFENYRGFAKDLNQEPITRNTALHVASVSKTITAMAILKLIDARKLKLENRVVDILVDFPYPEVTIKSLLTQRSGLPKYEYFIESIKPEPSVLQKKFLTNQDIYNLLVQYKPASVRPANTGFMYCNTNYAILALIIEKLTNLPFPKAMEKMVFQPLEMNNTYIYQEKDTLTSAKSFYGKNAKPHPLDRLDLIYGDKNVYTTPRDLFQFSKAMYSPDFLSRPLKDKIFLPYSNEKPGINNYGLGFRLKIYDEQHKLTYHNGWWHGSNAVFAHLENSKVTIIAIGNKFSRRVYSALSLSALFEDFPYDLHENKETENSILPDTNTQDSTKISTQ